MSNSNGEAGPEEKDPDEAFALLGNETRVQILRELGATDDGTLSFSELRDRVGIERGQNFNYHLNRLLGHFVGKVDDQYQLRPAGRRVVEAILSGSMTDSPQIDRTEIDFMCWYCGTPTIELSYRDEIVTLYCADCGGNYGNSSETFGMATPADSDRLGAMTLPPAGIKSRSPRDVAQTALSRYLLEMESIVANVCPRCSAPVETTLAVCQDHSDDEGVCKRCGRRYAAAVDIECANCILRKQETILGLYLLAVSPVQSFLIDHGFDTAAPSFERLFEMLAPYGEDIHTNDSLWVEITFTLRGESLTLTIDDELHVVDRTRS